jgi:hypothetical protein
VLGSHESNVKTMASPGKKSLPAPAAAP